MHGVRTYDAGDKLLSIANNGTQTRAYGYDGAGRPYAISSASGTVTLGYDYEDRVTSLTPLGGLTVNHYSYNALDARVGKTDSTGTYSYLRDGEGAADPLLSDGFARYLPGISRHDSSGTKFNHDDFLGTHKADTNSSGTTQATRSYDAFGNLTSTAGLPSGPLGFAGSFGYQEDPDSGLKLLGHRLYDASAGRFLTRDPVQSGSNWFSYVGSSPLCKVDPNGLYVITIGERPVDAFGDYHIFIDVYDDDPNSDTYGHTFRFEGEPAVREGGVFRDYGAVEVDELEYGKGQHPHDPFGTHSHVVLSRRGKSAHGVLKRLRGMADKIRNAKWHYKLIGGKNSNTVAYELILLLGLMDAYEDKFDLDGFGGLPLIHRTPGWGPGFIRPM